METVEQLLLRNLAEVFGQADSSKRAKAMESIWARDGELIDPQGRFVGHSAVGDAVGELHVRFPGFVFTALGSPQAFHEVGRLSWGHGPKGAPPKVTGVDVVRVRNGRIVALYTFVDVSASGPG
jgi:SnoaL-like domain